MRLCKTCAQEKPFDPQGATPKAKGFVGYVCWDCVKLASAARYQRTAGLSDPAVIALKAQRRELQAQARALRIQEVYAQIEAGDAAKEKLFEQYQKAQHVKNLKRIAKQDAKPWNIT